jgi:hypothetical protein
MAVVHLQQDKSCAVAVVAVDGHPLESPQDEITVAPGDHTLLLRITPARHPERVADAPLKEIFNANGRYTVMGLFSPATGLLKVRFIDEKKRAHSK